MGLAYSAKELAKRIAFRSKALNWISRPRYEYNLKPAQLAALVDAITRTHHLKGNIVEVGVARGMTTLFLLRHMQDIQDTRRYICVDTFSGFVPDDVAYEKAHRGKDDPALGGFAYNDPDVFLQNIQTGGHSVGIIQKDCGLLTKEDLGAVSVALLDVDLYLPTKRAIGSIYDAMEPGGVMMIDDVTSGVYDGSAAAYFEFCKERGIEPNVVADKGGMLLK
jgi:O-methyltransferase